ncbi:MAG: hypothetical protein V3V30_03800 [Parvularculaceae bacterium]
MSVVEKAVDSMSDLRLARRHQADQDELGTDTKNELMSAPTFVLDNRFLSKQGFYVPSEKPQRLALELRAVKRRLLRRLKFFKSEAERRKKQVSGDRQHNLILMTSTRPAEGKTFNAINLALSFAQEDNIGVILIDADVPRPKIFSHFGLSGHLGLTDRIVNPDLQLSDIAIVAEGVPLTLISEGTQFGSAADYYQRQEMSDFVTKLSAQYPDHLIIFDAPPVLATPEAVVLAKYVDEVVFIVEANGTPEPAVATALDEILDSTDRVSLVLNRCMVPESATHYGSYEEYYYRAKGGRGGQSFRNLD